MRLRFTNAILAALSSVAFMGTALADDATYAQTVQSQIAKNVTYPRLAKVRDQEGSVGYLVKIDGSGVVTDASVESTSGVASLDTATLDAVKAAAPFPAPPNGGATVHGK